VSGARDDVAPGRGNMREPRTLVAPEAHDFGDAGMSDIDRERVLARFWAKVNKTETCWLWIGCTRASRFAEYGAFWVDGRMVRAHRFSYELTFGKIPYGFVIDHVKARGCASTLCVRPSHLEAVTGVENISRGVGWGAINSRKTHCSKGHELSGENLIVRPNGRRRCATCNRAACAGYSIRAKLSEMRS
jgi:hypothetical protein